MLGEGDFFSSGADVKQRNDKHLFQMESTVVGRFMKLLVGFPKLVVAAVNGPAVGIGVTLLLHADIVYCTRKAWFWTPFSFLGLAPEYASSVVLPDIVGIYKANEMLLLGKRVSAEEALQFRLVAQIFDSRSNEEFLETICKSVLESISQIAVPEKVSTHTLSLSSCVLFSFVRVFRYLNNSSSRRDVHWWRMR
jgi:enoyl-CoA hydratase/carnithine racemase